MATPLSWPAAARIRSTLTDQDSLLALCDKYGVPKELKPMCANKLSCAAACDTPTNALCIYSDALEAGLRFPLHSFYVELLQHYGLAPSQLAPNAWRYMAAFVQRCKDAGGVEPLVPAFKYFFSLHAFKQSGWHHLIQRAGLCLFTGATITNLGWKEMFFFLEYPEGMLWRCPVAWGNLRMENASSVEVKLTEAAEAVVRKLKKMPRVRFRDYMSLHAHHPPVGALTTTVQLEPAAAASAQAPALASLHATLEEGDGARATDDGDDSPAPPKRRCADPAASSADEGDDLPPQKRWCPDLAAVDVGDDWTPRERRYPDTSFNGSSGSSEMSLPPGIRTADAIRYHDLVQKPTADLKGKLRDTDAACRKFLDFLIEERAENGRLQRENARLKADRLKDEHAASMDRLKDEHAASMDRLKDEHATEVQQLTKRLNDEHEASMDRLKAEHATEVEQLTKRLNDEHAATMDQLKQEHAADLARVEDVAYRRSIFNLFPEKVVEDRSIKNTWLQLAL